MNKSLEHRTREQEGLRPQRSANVLIVDDDVDSAILIESVFLHLGCQTTCSLGSLEARKKMCSQKADIIILDWVLDRHTDASTIINYCTHILTKFGGGKGPRPKNRPKIITFSSLDASEVSFPENPYFEHLDHWKKPIAQRDLLERALSLLDRIGV